MAANPFPGLQHTLQSQLYLDHSSSYRIQLHCLSAVLGFSLVLALVSLWLRIHRRQFWLYRLQPTAFGSWITPNPIVLWLTGSTAFLALAQVYIYYAYQYGTEGSDVRNAMVWRLIIWLPLWLGALNLVWTTVLAPLLSRTSEASGFFDLARHPHLFAAVFILPQLISIGLLVPSSVITNMRYNIAFQQGTALSLVVAEASEAFDAGRMDIVERLSESLARMTAVVEHSFDSMVSGWKIVWTIYGSLNVFLASTFIVGAVAHYRSLKKSMRTLKSASTSNQSAYSRQMKVLVWSYRALLFTTFLTVILSVSYLVISIFIAVDGKKVASGTPLTETMLLLPLYFVAFFGTLSNLVLLIRALFANPPQLGIPQPTRRKDALRISTTQEVSVTTEHTISFELLVSEKRTRISSGEGLGLGPIAH